MATIPAAARRLLRRYRTHAETGAVLSAPAYVNVPFWVARQRGFLEARGPLRVVAGTIDAGAVTEDFAFSGACAAPGTLARALAGDRLTSLWLPGWNGEAAAHVTMHWGHGQSGSGD